MKGSNEEKMGGATEERGSIVKYGETPFEGGGGVGTCGNPVGLSIYDGPMEMDKNSGP